VYCSFLQIYNEKLLDLLVGTNQMKPLKIREDKINGIYVEGLTEYVVENVQDCMDLLSLGEQNRIKRATRMNIHSSRSHSIFQCLLEYDKVDANGMIKRAKLNLGDLAGSEKLMKEESKYALSNVEDLKLQADAKSHLTELKNINLSLTTLGKVISLLAKPI